MFIQLSQLTRCPLYVSPFFNSTNWGRKGNIYKDVENQRKEASLFAEFKCLTLTMGWFCAVRKSERGSYNQERAVKTYWIETVSNIIWERLWNDYLPPCWMSDKDQPGYKAFLGNRAKTIGAPVANCFTGMVEWTIRRKGKITPLTLHYIMPSR